MNLSDLLKDFLNVKIVFFLSNYSKQRDFDLQDVDDAYILVVDDEKIIRDEKEHILSKSKMKGNLF